MIARPSVNKDGEHLTAIEYNDDQLPIAITEKGFSPKPEPDSDFETIERTTKLSYTNGNLTTLDGPRDDVEDLIQLAYDQNNRLQSLTQANGQTLKVLAYDVNGHPTQIQKGTQSPLTIAYTTQGKIKEITNHNRAVRYNYDSEGRLTQLATVLNNEVTETIKMAYDDAGRLNTLSDDMKSKGSDSIDN